MNTSFIINSVTSASGVLLLFKMYGEASGGQFK